MNKRSLCLVMAAALLLLAACAAGPNSAVNTAAVSGQVAGFFKGLGHGFITPFTFIISLFADSVSIYEVHNNGGRYNFGFVLGAMIIFGGSGTASSKK
jgi:carbohydrate-selective porin OprB